MFTSTHTSESYLYFVQWDIKKLCFEYDTEPYYQALDAKLKVKVIFEVVFPEWFPDVILLLA